MTIDQLKQQFKTLEKLEKFTDDQVNQLSETQKDQTHQALTQEVIAQCIDRMHQVNCIFKRGGYTSAKICVGTVTYDITVNAQNATQEEFKQWEDNLLGGTH